MTEETPRGTVCVTGATGYVGGRLVPMLLEQGWNVRVLVRTPAKLLCRPWARHPRLTIARGDLDDACSLIPTLRGCDAVFYLVHSMNPAVTGLKGFARADRAAASNMVRACDEARPGRLIYLGGLVPEGEKLSPHLQSRAEVATILAKGETPLTVLRAAQILGSGSASFEMVRYLVERLPVMITPRWVHNQCQPIAISNVLGYLAGCLDHPETAGQTYDIGGPDVLTYHELFDLYAEEAGLRRRIILPVPVLTPELSSHWLNLVTPIPYELAKPLVQGLRNRVVCAETRIRDIIPQDLISCREALRRALDRVREQSVPTCWTDAGRPAMPEWTTCGDAPYAGGDLLECAYAIHIDAPPEEVWKPIAAIGGETGWYQDNFLWRLRGILDKLAGGPGLRRGRRHPTEIGVGDALDFWRVIDVRPAERLLLLAEMKVPGDALLEFRLAPTAKGGTELWMLSWFLPRGLAGLAYWWALYPLHKRIFKGMLLGVARATGAAATREPWRLPPRREFTCALPKPVQGGTEPEDAAARPQNG